MNYFKAHRKQLIGFSLSMLIIALLVFIYSPPRIESPSKKSFIQFMLTRAEQSNIEILMQRNKLKILYDEYKQQRKLSPLSRDWLFYLASNYDVKDPDFKKDSTWQTLLTRVDIIPNSLVIAQAIDESNWGQSRFAQEGYNYFGIWCYHKGCGITPARATGHYHAVKRYATPLLSVQNYMSNINSHNAYREFRLVRAALRRENKPVTGLSLVHTLIYYSQRRSAYVNEIRQLITKYHLSQYDSSKYLSNKLVLNDIIQQLHTQQQPHKVKRTVRYPATYHTTKTMD